MDGTESRFRKSLPFRLRGGSSRQLGAILLAILVAVSLMILGVTAVTTDNENLYDYKVGRCIAPGELPKERPKMTDCVDEHDGKIVGQVRDPQYCPAHGVPALPRYIEHKDYIFCIDSTL